MVNADAPDCVRDVGSNPTGLHEVVKSTVNEMGLAVSLHKLLVNGLDIWCATDIVGKPHRRGVAQR